MNKSASTLTGKTKIKIVFLGDQSVGKTSIIERYIKNTFEDTANPTVGIDFLVKNTSHRGNNYRLQLWDTAGQERFRALIPNYLKDAKCALLIVDVSNPNSLNNILMWLNLYNENRTGEGFAVMIGNKMDLQFREVTVEQAQRKAEELKIPYFQVSAKNGANIQDLFEKIIDLVQKRKVSFSPQKGKEVIEENIREQESEVKEKKANIEEQLPEKEVNQNKETKKAVQQNVVLKNEESKIIRRKKGCC